MVKRVLTMALLLALTGCVGLINWTLDRSQCGLKCPKNSSCSPNGHGGIIGEQECLCDYPRPGVYNDSPSDGHPCLPKPKASPK